MPLTAATWAGALHLACEEADRLRAFIDDLDGWDGQDCDTGTNAVLTLEAMRRAVDALGPSVALVSALEVSQEAAVRGGVGHVGVLLGQVVGAWAAALAGSAPDAHVTPVALRRMLLANPWDGQDSRMEWGVAVEAMFDEATSELETLGDTLPAPAGIVSLFSSQAQYGLVNATSERTGRVDAGAAVLAVLFASLDARVRDDHAVLAPLAQMLADLAGSPGAASPRPQAPAPGRAFTVDIVLQGTHEDLAAALVGLGALGARHSVVGRADLFGVGEWRLHVDTSAPLAVRPRVGTVWRFQVCDARPDEMIGVDTLSDGITHRGVRLLERRTLRRVERASVVACTRAPGLVEDLAQAGATVLLSPAPDDSSALVTAVRRSSTGVCLVAPCDAGSRDLAEAVAAATGPGVLVAGTREDLSVLAVGQACGTLFVPRPGGPPTAGTLARMLREASAQALSRSTVVPLVPDADGPRIAAAVHEVAAFPARRWRVLVGRDDGPLLVAVLRQVIAQLGAVDRPSGDLEVIDGGQVGASLLQGLR